MAATALPSVSAQGVAVASAPRPVYRLEHAGFWPRTGAFVVDFLLVLPVVMFSQVVMPIFGGLLVWWLYFALFESSNWHATPGKRALGLEVADVNGVHLRFGRASLRFAGKLLSAAPALLGFLLAAWTPHKQALHDLIASTLVLKAR